MIAQKIDIVNKTNKSNCDKNRRGKSIDLNRKKRYNITDNGLI